MLTKFLDFDKIYNFCFNEKIVTQKNLSLQAFVIATLENSFGRSTLVTFYVKSYLIVDHAILDFLKPLMNLVIKIQKVLDQYLQYLFTF